MDDGMETMNLTWDMDSIGWIIKQMEDGRSGTGEHYLDICLDLSPEYIPDLVERLRAMGEDHFTISTQSCSALVLAKAAVQAGCRIAGMADVRTIFGYGGRTSPALLFEVSPQKGGES